MSLRCITCLTCGPCDCGPKTGGWEQLQILDVIGSRAITNRGAVQLSAGNHLRPGQTVTVAKDSGISVGSTVQHRSQPRPRTDDPPVVMAATADAAGPFFPAAQFFTQVIGGGFGGTDYRQLPGTVMVPDERHYLRSLYPVETGAGFRSPQPVNQEFPLLEIVPPITRQELERTPRVDYPHLDHYALRKRDPLVAPYGSGIKNGLRYTRVYDVPLGDQPYFLRSGGLPLLPDDGESLWAKPAQEWVDLWSENPALNIFFTKPVAGAPTMITGQHAYVTRGGADYFLYHTESSQTLIGSGTFRDLHRASLTAAVAGVTRIYEDGTEEAEAGVPALDMLLRPVPTGTQVFEARFAAYNEILSAVSSESYTTGAAGSAGGDGTRVGLTLAGAFGGSTGSDLYYDLISAGTVFPAVPDARDRGLGVTLSFQAAGISVGNAAGQQLAYSSSGSLYCQPVVPAPSVQTSGVKRRYRNDGGSPAVWNDPATLTAGRVVYEGPLGILPAPLSGRTETWCGLDVDGTSHFAADAWTEKGVRFAAVLYAGGALHVSQQSEGGALTIWRGTAAVAGIPPALGLTLPQLSYSFMLPGWPFEGRGSFALPGLQGTQMLRVVSSKVGGGKLAPVALTPDASLANLGGGQLRTGSVVHQAQTTTPVSRTVLPSRVRINGQDAPGFLGTFRRPAPGEAQAERPKAQLITGELELDFAVDWAFPVDEVLPTAPLVVSFLIPARQAVAGLLDDLIATPAGWEREIGYAAPGRTFTLLHFSQFAVDAKTTFKTQVNGLRLACPRAFVGSTITSGGGPSITHD